MSPARAPQSRSALTVVSLRCRREDLEDLLADPAYFQAVFHTLPQVKLLYQGQSELGSANESIASKYEIHDHSLDLALITRIAHNLTYQDDLYKLRSETQEAFERAKSLEARWKEIEKEQREVYQVSFCPSSYQCTSF